jgi:hypothetical protein
MVPSQPKAGDWFGEQRSSQKMAKKSKLPVVKPGDDARQAEAEKIMRLRALRLAKEAADKDAVSVKVRKRRSAGRVEDAPAAIE